MKKAVIEGAFKVSVVTTPSAGGKRGEVLLSIDYVGICGSDYLKFNGKYLGIHYPVTPGHEFTAEVEEVAVTGSTLKRGDKVVVNPNLPCGQCSYCAKGEGYLCSNLRVIGAKSEEGAMQERLWVPSANCVPIEANADERNIALTEPMAVAVHAVRDRPLGSRTALMGCGNIGMLVLSYLAERNVEIDIIDVNIQGLEMPTHARIGKVMSLSDALDRRAELRESYDTVLVTCPYDSELLGLCAEISIRGGQMILVGLPVERISADYSLLLNKEITIRQSYKNSVADFLAAYEFLKTRDLRHLLNVHVFPIDRAAEAFQFKQGNPRSKVLVSCRS
jgi:L-iditol 2-dehydrogenase